MVIFPHGYHGAVLAKAYGVPVPCGNRDNLLLSSGFLDAFLTVLIVSQFGKSDCRTGVLPCIHQGLGLFIILGKFSHAPEYSAQHHSHRCGGNQKQLFSVFLWG